jgi:predicted ester cyclase
MASQATQPEVRARITAFAAAVTAGDEPGMRVFLSGDYFGHAAASGEPTQADRWAALVPDVRAALPDLAITVEEVSTTDDGLVQARVVVTGTHTSELWGAPPTGREVRWVLALTLRAAGDGWAINGDGPPVTVITMLRDLGVIPPADQMHLPPPHPVRPPEFLLKLGFTGQAADRPCSHLATVRVFEPATHTCAQCVATGGVVPSLRMCLVCGFTGCCDTSTNRHMRQHHEATGHSIFRSVRLKEGWIWCYEDAAFFERSTLERLAAAAQRA